MLTLNRALWFLLAPLLILCGCANPAQLTPISTAPRTKIIQSTSSPVPASPVPSPTLAPSLPQPQGELQINYLTRTLGFTGDMLVPADEVAGPEQQITTAFTRLTLQLDAPIQLVEAENIVIVGSPGTELEFAL